MTADDLRAGWDPRRVGRRVVLLAETESTNRVALEAAGEPDGDGLAVFADYQTAGRGRLGRSWSSPRGASVLGSVLLLTHEDDAASGEVGGRLTLAAAVAACDAIREAAHVTPSIKWPNDLVHGGRKLGGILIESRALPEGGRAWVIGIGINCLQQAGHFPAELGDGATSLELIASHPIDRTEVARQLLRALDGWLAEPAPTGDDRLHAAWLTHAEPIGRRVRLRCEGREIVGRTVQVEPTGGLIVQTDAGRPEWCDPMRTSSW